MGRYVTQPPPRRPVKKQQVFTTSGTFTPSQALLDAGGAVEVRCVGAGGAGGTYSGGSSGMDITRIVVVSGPVSVTIGAGGLSHGGASSFGSLLTAWGGRKPVSGYRGGASVGEGSQAGGNVVAVNSLLEPGSGGGSGGGGHQGNAIPNTGGGGGGNQAGDGYGGYGGSGLCIVTWEE